ncbi:MAG: HAMP domain-containing histidine kinase [Bacteroidaceae bacterium]|nr:HAMP domain-containing histidine kinase [Bacteroidaceae bacterium]
MKVAILIIVLLIIAFGISLLIVRRRYIKLLDLATKRAQKSEQLKSVFIDNISRTLRSPLNAIVNSCNKLLEEKDGNLQSAQVMTAVTNISDYSKELLDYVLQLHEMSKFEGITPSFTFIEVNLTELMASYRREAMNYTKPDVTVRVISDLSPHCRAILDTNLMHQLMMHLLTSAAKHVTHGDIFIKYNCERRGLKVAVSYQGLDLSELAHGDIYSLLQEDDAMKDSGKSTALSLAICRAIVDMFGGEFFMDSEGDKKNVASFWFPCEMKDVYKDL